eukprot:g16475.t1
MSCFSGLATAFCGDQIKEEANRMRELERLQEENENLKNAVLSPTASPTNKKWFEKKLEGELKKLDDKHAGEICAWQSQINEKTAEMNELRAEKASLEVKLSAEKSRISALEGKVHDQSGVLGNFKSTIDGLGSRRDSTDIEADVLPRAFQMDWEQLRELEVIERSSNEPRHVSDKYREMQKKLQKPPQIAGKPFREFATDVYAWVKKLYPLGNSFDELGEELLEGAFVGAHHEKQRAKAAGPDIIKIMTSMTTQMSPLVDTVEQQLERYLPKVVRRDQYTPMAHYHLMQDVYDLEKQVCGNDRSDKNKWERTASSLLLDKHSEVAVRAAYKQSAENNFDLLGTTLTVLNCDEDVGRYEYMTTHKLKGNPEDFLDRVFQALGEGAVGTDQRRKVQSVNNFYKSIGVQQQQQSGHSFFGGGDQFNTEKPPRRDGAETPRAGNQTPQAGKRFTQEEIKEMQKKPCQFGKKCYNLMKTGKCLFKHTKEELTHCLQCFERDYPDKAAARKKEKEDRKKKQEKAAADKKKAEAAASGTS